MVKLSLLNLYFIDESIETEPETPVEPETPTAPDTSEKNDNEEGGQQTGRPGSSQQQQITSTLKPAQASGNGVIINPVISGSYNDSTTYSEYSCVKNKNLVEKSRRMWYTICGKI